MNCDLLSIYKWTILAALICAPTLSILGCHVATRGKSVQALCISQGAMLGAIIGLFLEHKFEWPFIGTVTVLIGAAAAFFLAEFFAKKRSASKNTLFCGLFAALLAFGNIFSALCPGVENHMTQVFFGDLATLTDRQSWTLIIMGVIGLAFLLQQNRIQSRATFAMAIFGKDIYTHSKSPLDLFSLLSLIAMTISVQYLGFLFTIAALFIPTGLALVMGNHGLRTHFIYCAFVSSIAAGIGFHFSLHYSKVPTVPIIVVFMVCFGLMTSLVYKNWKKWCNS